METRLPYMFKSRARFGNGKVVEVPFVDFTDVTVRKVTEEEVPVVLRYSLKGVRPLGYEVRHDGERFLVPAYQIAFAQANWATHRSPFSVGLPTGLVEYVALFLDEFRWRTAGRFMLEYFGEDTVLSPFYAVDDVEEFLDDNGPQRLAAVHDAIGRLRILGDTVLVETDEPFLTLEDTGQVFLTPAMPPEQLALIPDDERRSVITVRMTDVEKLSELARSLGVNSSDARISGMNFDMLRPELFRHDGVRSMTQRVASDIGDVLADDIGQRDAVDVRRWLALRDAPHALDMRSVIKTASALSEYLPEGDLRRLAELRLKACWRMLED